MAYARIVEGSKMSLPKAIGLALSNISGDYREAVKAKRLVGNMTGIPLFRSAQFIGAWQGFRAPHSVSATLLQRFYYPAEATSATAAVEPGRKIKYS
jgi:hypothetical protein